MPRSPHIRLSVKISSNPVNSYDRYTENRFVIIVNVCHCTQRMVKESAHTHSLSRVCRFQRIMKRRKPRLY